VHLANFGNDCKGCHASIVWVGLHRDIGLHAHPRTRYPLAGKHLELACAVCHDPKKPADKRFKNLRFDKCTACHADKHTGEFAARAGGGNCDTCHAVEGFAPARFTMAMHRETAFPLDGKHEAAPCLTCHPGARPRLNLHVDKRACADCHQNPHGDQFAAEMAAGGCAKCHSTSSWGEAKVDHSTWPLVGAHGRTACVRCHGAVKATSMDKAQFRGVPRNCEGCHTDPHAGQFRLNEPVRACDACHTPDRWQLPAFEHTQMTGYELSGKHAGLKCEQCHVKETLRNGDTATRWRLGYRNCRACHADPHGAAP
jgi:hypothetical protein